MIVRLDIHHSELEGFEYAVRAEGEDLFGDSGLSSMLHCMASAIEGMGAEVKAAEFAFRGIVSGTYPLQVLATRPNEVAQHAVNTTNAVLEAENE
jgi:hypothetical protein